MRLKPISTIPRQGAKRRYDDLIGLLGGLLCLVLSEFDRDWGVFWLVAGVILLIWSAGSYLYTRFKR